MTLCYVTITRPTCRVLADIDEIIRKHRGGVRISRPKNQFIDLKFRKDNGINGIKGISKVNHFVSTGYL